MARGPEGGVHRVRIAGGELHVDAAGVLILVEHLLERLPTVGGAEDPAFGVGAVGVAEDRDEEAVRILGIDRDARDLPTVAEAEVRPCLTGVG